MTDDNRLSASLAAEDITAILAAITTLNNKLPFLLSLTAQQRRDMPKMSDKSAAFDDKCSTYMTSNPELLPGFVSAAEVGKDRDLRNQIMQFFPQLSALHEAVDDTLMVVNSEIWMADLAYYQSAREAAHRNRPGAEAIYTDLRQRFPGIGRRPASAASATS
jgi:hypothetical protein